MKIHSSVAQSVVFAETATEYWIMKACGAGVARGGVAGADGGRAEGGGRAQGAGGWVSRARTVGGGPGELGSRVSGTGVERGAAYGGGLAGHGKRKRSGPVP